MKRFFAFIICLILLMANNAFSIDDGREENEHDPSRNNHHQVGQNNDAGLSLTGYYPWNWTGPRDWSPARKRAVLVASFGVLCGIHLLRDYMATRREESKCRPSIDSRAFVKYNVEHNTHLLPTAILEQWGANIQNNPILSVLNSAYEAGKKFQYPLTNITVNGSRIECQYSPSTQLSIPSSCPERDISFNLTYDVHPRYFYYKNYGYVELFYLAAIQLALYYCFFA